MSRPPRDRRRTKPFRIGDHRAWAFRPRVDILEDRVLLNTYTVTNTNDSGSGSLRQAILDANGHAGLDTIAFNISGGGVKTITPTSALPTIIDPVILDATTQPGYAGNPLIELNGSNAGNANGLEITAGNSTVKGFVINRFGSVGVLLQNKGNNVIAGNYIGTNATGTAASPNNSDGIDGIQTSNNLVGGTTPGSRNIISGNRIHGVEFNGYGIGGTSGNQILGNYIGVDVSGRMRLGNGYDGVVLASVAPHNIVGGLTAAARNIISGNGANAIRIEGVGTSDNLVQGNFIGTDVTGTVLLGNSAVDINNAPSNTIGGTMPGAGNVIVGTGDGVHIIYSGATRNIVQGNLIGTDVTGTIALGNTSSGVAIINAAANTVGGTVAGARNIIARSQFGVNISNNSNATGNTVEGNYIGTDITGTRALGNAVGVWIDKAPQNTIGGTMAAAGNLISGNIGDGIQIINQPPGSGANGNIVQGNLIGTNAAGNAALPNNGDGIGTANGAANNTIGGTAAGAGNTIAYNRGAGVNVLAGTGNAIQRNSIFANSHLGIDGNGLPNFPVVTAATTIGNTTTILGTLPGSPNTGYTLEFFSNTAPDPSGFGQGQTYIGTTTVTTDGSGNVAFTATITPAVSPGRYISATATRSDHTTSKFSQTRQVSGAAQHLRITGPANSTAGVAFSITVTAIDASGYTVAGYRGTAHFTSTDAAATLPSDYPYTAADGGVHTFMATLKTAGNRVLTVRDTADSSINGMLSVAVNPAAADHLDISAPARVYLNMPLSVTVAARDLFNNVATGYTGTIHFSSSDPFAGLPPDYRFMPADAGQKSFTLTLASAGNQTITATDTANPAVHGSATVLVVRQLFYPPNDTPVGANPQAVAVGDFNGDGIPDLAVANSDDNTVSILLGQGDGTFVNAGTLPTDLYPLSVAVADFNGDGLLDLAVVNRDNSTLTVFLGNGDGTFTAAPAIPVGLFPSSVAVGDVNGDGVPDLVVADTDDAAVAVLLGNGDGSFQAPIYSPAGGFPTSVAVGDFNGDGLLDVATANPGSNTVSVLLGNGDGTFQFDAQKIYRVGTGPVSLAVADLNGDGVPDLAVANSGSQNVSILLGNGDGTFQPAQSYAAGAMPLSVAVGDFNGDGVPDLAIANQGDSTASVLIGNGDGSFQAAVSFAVGRGPAAVAVADFNSDGAADLVTANADADTISVLLNAGDWPTLPGPAPSANGHKDRPAQVSVPFTIGTIWAKLPELHSRSAGTSTNDSTTRSAEQAAAVDRLFREAHEVRPADVAFADAWTDPLLDDLGSVDSRADWLSESLLHAGIGPAASTLSTCQTTL